MHVLLIIKVTAVTWVYRSYPAVMCCFRLRYLTLPKLYSTLKWRFNTVYQMLKFIMKAIFLTIFQTYTIMELHTFLSFVALSNNYYLSETMTRHPFTHLFLGRWFTFATLTFCVSCECWICQAIFPHYVSYKSQLFFSDPVFFVSFFL